MAAGKFQKIPRGTLVYGLGSLARDPRHLEEPA